MAQQAFLQTMRTRPVGQSLDDSTHVAGAGMYKMLDPQLRQKREQQTREAVERIKATSRGAKPRPAWGTRKSPPRKQDRIRSGPAQPRSPLSRRDRPSRRREVPETTSPPPRTTGTVDASYVHRLEEQLHTLQHTVSSLQEAQESQSVGVDPGFLVKIEKLKKDHSRNVDTIEKLFREKQRSDKRAAELEAELAAMKRGGGGVSARPSHAGRSQHAAAPAPARARASRSQYAPAPAPAPASARDRPSRSQYAPAPAPAPAPGPAPAPAPTASRYEDDGGFDFDNVGGPGGGDESAPPDIMLEGPGGGDESAPPPMEQADSPTNDAYLAASQDDLTWARRVREVYLSTEDTKAAARGRSGSASVGSRRSFRSQSAGPPGRRSSKVTKPKPFMMELRESAKSKTKRQLELEAIRQQELDDEAEEEARRLRRSKGGPFKGLMQREEERQARLKEREEKLKEEERQLKAQKFKANPVPKTMVSEDYTMRKEAEERERRERIARRSQELLNKSKMPPRMQLREVSLAQQKSASRKKETLSGDDKSQPKIKPRKVPDFDRLKAQWEHKLVAVRMKNSSTAPKPFAMEERQKFHDAKREDRARRQQAKEEKAARDERAAEIRKRKAAMRTGPKGEQPMTRAVELRMKAVREAEAKKLKAEARERREAAIRKKKQQQSSAELRPVIAAMERERKELMGGEYKDMQDYVPDKDGEIPEAARARMDEAKAKFDKQRADQQQNISQALNKRPTLFERSEIQRKSQDAKRSALATIAQNVYSGGGTNGGGANKWKSMANASDWLTEEEKREMGVDLTEGDQDDMFA